MIKLRLSKLDLESADPSTWTDQEIYKAPEEVDLRMLYPIHVACTTRFTLPLQAGETARDIYIKQPSYLDKACRQKLEARVLAYTGELVAREVAICERLRVRPHSGLAEYRGVYSDNKKRYKVGNSFVEIPLDTERVLGIVYKWYDCTLYELVGRGEVFNLRYCLQCIANAIEHMHSLGIVHCDIKPHNVFVRTVHRRFPEPHHWVLGDFDSAHDVGAPMKLKGGSKGWTRVKSAGQNSAENDDDWYAFQKVKEWLVRERGGNFAMLDGIGKKELV
jgi:serine/threonine protein kinase